jgi:putative endonuclease
MTRRWYVYMIYSALLDRLYTGISVYPARRLAMHNAGKGAKATRAGRPWKMVYLYPLPVEGRRGDALKEEARIKKLTRAEKDKLLTRKVED